MLLVGELKAQMPQFSQFYAVPMYMNPAFTGNTIQGRLSLDYRLQWPSVPGAFKTFQLSYDHNISEANSGVGVMVLHDKAGSGGLTYTSFAGLYSYDIVFNRKLRAKLGLRASYNQRVLDVTKLVFTDQLLRNGALTSTENISSLKVGYFDFSFGGLLYGYDFWVGAAVDHINSPNESLLGETSLVPIKGSFQAGKNFSLQKNMKHKDVKKITAAFNYKFQGEYDQFDIGAYYTQFPIVFGLWYRGLPLFKAYEKGYANNDALVVILGLDMHDFRIGYSYDITMSKLASNTGGSHELTLIYEFASPHKKRKSLSRRFKVPCAKF